MSTPGSCIVREATGNINNTVSSQFVANCTDAACKFGFDFSSCKNAAADCKYGLLHDFQVWSRCVRKKDLVGSIWANARVLSGDEHGFRIWSNHHCWNLFCHSLLRSGLISQRTQGFSGETTKAMITATSHQYCVTWALLLHLWRRLSCCHVPTGSMQGQHLPWSGHLCQGLWKEQWTPQRLHPDFWDRSCLHPHW